MLTKADFQQAIADSVAGYPAIAPLYQAGDPRITQHLDAMATMLGMLCAQLEVAMAEPFDKTRDATVLADAAMRGIIPKSTPARVRIQAKNKGAAPFAVETGRTVFDSAGLPYRVETAATVAAGGTATFDAQQLRAAQVLHTVAGTAPFYAIEIPAADDDAFLCGVSVSDADGEFSHVERYVNIADGERVFHIEADDRQRVYVRFGFTGFVGVQPADGSVITLTLLYSSGEVNPDFGSPFSFEYIGSPAESAVDLTMSALVAPGINPHSMAVLRDLARYPSVYDHNAVYLGEFDFLVRSNFQTLQFLSVWNEQAEERARGPNIESINTLFVACLSATGTESVLTEVNPAVPVTPEKIQEAALTDTQLAIRRTILAADDSYRVRFVTPVRSKIAMTINARVSTSYVASDVQAKIVEALLAEFGAAAAASRRGRNRPLYQRVYALLRAKVAALSGGGADLTVNMADVESLVVRPEMWRYVAADSLTVTVSTANIVTPGWGR